MFEHSVGELAVSEKNLNVTPVFFRGGRKQKLYQTAAIRLSGKGEAKWAFFLLQKYISKQKKNVPETRAANKLKNVPLVH